MAIPQIKFGFFPAFKQSLWPFSGLFSGLLGFLLKFSCGNPASGSTKPRQSKRKQNHFSMKASLNAGFSWTRQTWPSWLRDCGQLYHLIEPKRRLQLTRLLGMFLLKLISFALRHDLREFSSKQLFVSQFPDIPKTADNLKHNINFSREETWSFDRALKMVVSFRLKASINGASWPGPSPGFSSRRGQKTKRGATKQKGSPILKIHRWIYAATGGPNVKWRALISNRGTGHHWPPAGDGPARGRVLHQHLFMLLTCFPPKVKIPGIQRSCEGAIAAGSLDAFPGAWPRISRCWSLCKSTVVVP